MSMVKRKPFPKSSAHKTLRGKQTPYNLREAPAYDHGEGREIIAFAKIIGVELMPWQEYDILAMCSKNEVGRYVHSDNILIIPRQNGKSLGISLICLYRAIKYGWRILYTAQLWDTANSIYLNLLGVVKAFPPLADMLTRFSGSQGKGVLEFSCGGVIFFQTRGDDTARGITKISCVVYDEAYNLTDGSVAAINFTTQAADDPQFFYITSAVHKAFKAHQDGRVISAMRRQALAGPDPVDPIYLAEYRAPGDAKPDVEETWILANPSYGFIMDETKIRKQMKRLNTEIGRINFGVECLGWGDWFNDEDDEDFTPIIDYSDWEAATVVDPVLCSVGAVSAVGIDVDLGAVGCALVSAEKMADGGWFLSLAPRDEFDRVGVVADIERVIGLRDPIGFAYDQKGVAETCTVLFEQRGLEPTRFNKTEVSKAYMLFMQLWRDGKIKHDGSPRWVDALSVVSERDIQDSGKALKRNNPAGCPLIAATFALMLAADYKPAEVDVKRAPRVTMRISRKRRGL